MVVTAGLITLALQQFPDFVFQLYVVTLVGGIFSGVPHMTGERGTLSVDTTRQYGIGDGEIGQGVGWHVR